MKASTYTIFRQKIGQSKIERTPLKGIFCSCYPIVILTLILIFQIHTSHAQSRCSSATVLSNVNIDSTTLCSNTGACYWFKITAFYDNYSFLISQPAQTPFAGSKSISIYDGTCTALHLVYEDSIALWNVQLEPGRDYYIRVAKQDTGYSYFNLLMKTGVFSDRLKSWVVNDCPPAPDCNSMIMNPGFNPTSDFDPNNINHQLFTFGTSEISSYVCGWIGISESPNLCLPLGSSSAPSAKMWSLVGLADTVDGEAIRQDIIPPFINSANYTISFNWLNNSPDNATCDEFCIYFVRPNVILNSSTNFHLSDVKNTLDAAVLAGNAFKVTNPALLNLAISPPNTWTPVSVNYICPNNALSRVVMFPYDENDANGVLMLIDDFNITGPTNLHSLCEITTSCTGKNDGALDLTPFCGTPPYPYVWSNGATTQDILNINPGNYSVTVTDAVGNTFSGAYTITVATPMTTPDLGQYNINN